jgi:Atypical PilZ domain, cyclic di-GMP receptor
MTPREGFDGISLYERLPLTWVSAELGDAAELDHANHEAARALQALAVFEEMPREPVNDSNQAGQELVHLQTKVDVLLSLVGRLLAQQPGAAVRHSLVLRATGCEWAGPDAERVKPGETGYLSIYANPSLPLALRLPGKTLGSVERSGGRWLQTHFECLSPAVASGLEKLVFRRHRRQVALTKGTGVFTETGIFKASRF